MEKYSKELADKVTETSTELLHKAELSFSGLCREVETIVKDGNVEIKSVFIIRDHSTLEIDAFMKLRDRLFDQLNRYQRYCKYHALFKIETPNCSEDVAINLTIYSSGSIDKKYRWTGKTLADAVISAEMDINLWLREQQNQEYVDFNHFLQLEVGKFEGTRDNNRHTPDSTGKGNL